MPIEVRTITGTAQGINSFDLQQSTAAVNNENVTETFTSFLNSSTRYIEQIAQNFSMLVDGVNENALAYVEDAQGTAWLPYTLGGTYYPKGWYVWSEGEWNSSKSNVAETLEALGSGTGGAGAFSGDYNDLINQPTIPTQITDSEITALGYVKTDNDTQLSDADITALGYIKSAPSRSYFQVHDDGVTTQETTAAYVNVKGLWATPTLTSTDFTFDAATGQVTTNKAGVLEVSAKVTGKQTTGNARAQTDIVFQKNGVTLTGDKNYSSRNLTQDSGGAYITNFRVNCAIGDVFRLRVRDIGVAVIVGHSEIAGYTYISLALNS